MKPLRPTYYSVLVLVSDDVLNRCEPYAFGSLQVGVRDSLAVILTDVLLKPSIEKNHGHRRDHLQGKSKLI